MIFTACPLRIAVQSAVIACPHCRRKVRLPPNSATVAVFCDSLTFVRQCGQGLRATINNALGVTVFFLGLTVEKRLEAIQEERRRPV